MDFKKILAGVTLFKDLDPRLIEAIAECASSVTYKSREFICRRGEESDSFYIIRHGRVAIEIYSARRGPLVVKTLGEDDILGWSWIIPPYKRVFDGHTLELTRVIKIDATALRSKCDEDTSLCFELMRRFLRVIGQRLEDTTLQLLDIYGDNSL